MPADTPAEACPRCDRVECPLPEARRVLRANSVAHTRKVSDATIAAQVAYLHAVNDCAAHAVDWRTRALAERSAREAAERERDHLRAIVTEALDRAHHDDHCDVIMAYSGDGTCDCRVRDLRAALSPEKETP